MAEKPRGTPELVEAQGAVTEAKRVLEQTVPLLIDRLLIVTGGNTSLVLELMQDIANIAGQAGTLAVALRRKQAVKYRDEHQELHPDKMNVRQESVLFGQDGAKPTVDSLTTIEERAQLVKEGKSPIQQVAPPPKLE